MPNAVGTKQLNVRWWSAQFFRRLNAPKALKIWLLETGSLTAKIRQTCPEMRVVVLSEKWQVPLAAERNKLGLKQSEHAWVRCVVLMCGEQPLIYARTVIPSCTQGNAWYALKQLGNRPLGEILFQLKTMQRTPFLLTKLPLHSWPYLSEYLTAENLTKLTTKTSYARQSLFKQNGHSLLLTEAFIKKETNQSL